jgi:DNA-binding GntR family transcriptional regulator
MPNTSATLARTVTDQVYEQVRDRIRSGTLEPGARIDQNALARVFGTSIVPVREALARLRADGLVRLVPHRGAFVEAISPSELIDIYSTREVLEEQAAQLAAPNLTDDDIQRLQRLLADMEDATHSGDFEALFALNRAFHFTIYVAARRRNLLQIIRQLWDQGDRYRRIYTELPERAHKGLDEHRAIMEACRRRDAAAIGYSIRHHIHQTTVELLERRLTPQPAAEGGNDGALTP